MKIQEFAQLLKQTDNVSPLLRALQDLRGCTVAQLEPCDPSDPTCGTGWNPWEGGGQFSRTLAPNP